MRNFLRLLGLVVVLPGHALAVCVCPGNPGRVCFLAVANASFDIYTSNPTLAQQQWMRDHYDRMLVYSPYFDSRLSWFPNGWVYKDTYAIYPGSPVATNHPEWILKDGSGNKLWIPFACSGGSCTQYAADVGNPAFRANWIAELQTTMAHPYKGVFEDDFNMRLQTSDGNGNLVVPQDPRTNLPMTVTDWRAYFATFQAEIRAAFPGKEMAQNQPFYFCPASDPSLIAATQHADVVWLERGFNDSGITGGFGPNGFQTLLGYIDAAHADGAGVVAEMGSSTFSTRDYGLATYFLFNNGCDGFSSRNGGKPDDWWMPGYQVDLGPPLGGRTITGQGIFRRDFTKGIVLANQPGAPTTTVNLGSVYMGLDGFQYMSVTLTAAQGITLLNFPPPPCGDVNGDAVQNVGDALLAAQFDVGVRTCTNRGPMTYPELCDVNQDGNCNIGDALKMAQCDVHLTPCATTCGAFACP